MINVDDINDAWGGVGLTAVEVLGSNAFGTLIIRDDEGRYWRLRPQDLCCEPVADSRAALDALAYNQDFLNDWYMPEVVHLAESTLGPLVEDLSHPVLLETEHQLAAYFAGTLKNFTVPLDFNGTEFQKSVWAALLTIPFGETRSYGDIARQIGRPGASRAVGAANGKNPISIIAPCHRVIGAAGALTGFAGGLDIKRRLLGLESSEAGAVQGQLL